MGDPLQPQLVGPLHHLMLQGFCPRLAEEATKAFHEDGPFRPCQPTIGKPSHPKTAILLLFFFNPIWDVYLYRNSFTFSFWKEKDVKRESLYLCVVISRKKSRVNKTRRTQFSEWQETEMNLLTCRAVCIWVSVSSVMEFPGAGSSRLRTINSELNGAT